MIASVSYAGLEVSLHSSYRNTGAGEDLLAAKDATALGYLALCARFALAHRVDPGAHKVQRHGLAID